MPESTRHELIRQPTRFYGAYLPSRQCFNVPRSESRGRRRLPAKGRRLLSRLGLVDVVPRQDGIHERRACAQTDPFWRRLRVGQFPARTTHSPRAIGYGSRGSIRQTKLPVSLQLTANGLIFADVWALRYGPWRRHCQSAVNACGPKKLAMLSIALAIISAPAAPATSRAPARAVVRIEKPARASEEVWRSSRHRKERLVTDSNGRTWRLRMIEFE